MKTVLKTLVPFKRYFILFKISKKVLCYNTLFLCYDSEFQYLVYFDFRLNFFLINQETNE